MAKQSKTLQFTLIGVVAKSFLAETEKPNAAKLQKHLDKHLAFATAVEKADYGWSVAYGKKKEGLFVAVKTPAVKTPAEPAKTED